MKLSITYTDHGIKKESIFKNIEAMYFKINKLINIHKATHNIGLIKINAPITVARHLISNLEVV